MSKSDDQRPTSSYGSPSFHTQVRRPNSVPPSLPDYIARDIVEYVQAAVGRFGNPGRVEYRASFLYLSRPQSEDAVVSIAHWEGSWAQLDEGTRQRRADEAARALSPLRSRPSQASPRRPIFIDLKFVMALLVLAGIGLWIYAGGDDLPAGESDASGGTESGEPSQKEGRRTAAQGARGETTGDARTSRVCQNTLTRVFQGGTVSVADAEGFRVEIALLRASSSSSMVNESVLRDFVEDPGSATGSRFIWTEEPDLTRVATSDSVVVVRPLSLGDGPDRIEGAVLSFGGSLVDAYFTESERHRYFHIATSLVDATRSTHGALYARCFDRPQHALGAWFFGADPNAAVTSLVYFMGTYARPLHLAKPYYRLPGEEGVNRLHAFQSISEKTAPLTRADLATLLGKEGGMATTKDEKELLITFPFGDGNRASRASRGVARVTSLGI